MNIKNKKIRLMGKSTALTIDEYTLLLARQNAVLVNDESFDILIEGRMMNPIEDDLFQHFYKEKKEIIPLKTFEIYVCQNIEDNALLMSLKLSKNTDRLFDFLTNQHIKDSLFLSLLKMYNWHNDGLLQSDENRDICRFIVKRFYANKERNHNIEYSPLGIYSTILDTTNSTLLDIIAGIKPLNDVKNMDTKSPEFLVLKAIAMHKNSKEETLLFLLSLGDLRLKKIIAQNTNISLFLAQKLYKDPSLHLALSLNEYLPMEIVQALLKKNNVDIQAQILIYTQIKDELFELIKEIEPSQLALNTSLNTKQISYLFSLDNDLVYIALAQNTATPIDILKKLSLSKNIEIDFALASNSKYPFLNTLLHKNNKIDKALALNINTPKATLEKLSKSDDINILINLAKNEATPIDILMQFQLDKRLERFVQENKTFGAKIHKDIGWLQ